jgi:hypothetical protein
MEPQPVELATSPQEHTSVDINTAHDTGNAQEGDQPNIAGHQSTPQAQQAQIPLPDAQKRKTEEPGSRLMGISAYQSPYSGNRSYDYEKKYEPDPVGKEMDLNARVWKVYLDETEEYDDEMLRGFKDTIDSLLVFVSSTMSKFQLSLV